MYHSRKKRAAAADVQLANLTRTMPDIDTRAEFHVWLSLAIMTNTITFSDNPCALFFHSTWSFLFKKKGVAGADEDTAESFEERMRWVCLFFI